MLERLDPSQNSSLTLKNRDTQEMSTDQYSIENSLFYEKQISIPKDYYLKSDKTGTFVILRILGIFFLVITAAPFLFTKNITSTLILWILIGWSAYRIQFILHDASHKTLFSNLNINEKVAYFSGLLIGVNFSMYRYTHMNHHRANGQPIDPQYADYLGHKNVTKWQYLSFVISPLFGGRFITYLKREILQLTPNNQKDPKAPEISFKWYLHFLLAQLLIASLLSGFGKHLEVIPLYYISLSTISLFLARLRTIAEHEQVNEVIDNFSRTHNFHFFEWLLLYDNNFNYHLEHHLFPQVPAQKLGLIYNNHTASLHTKTTHSNSMFKTITQLYKKLSH